MSRAVRTTRGVIGASISTVLAAASHALAGGDISPLAIIATTLFVLPLCVALAGKTGSVWRLSLAIGGSQFFYHWTFSGIGVGVAGFNPLGAFSSSSHAAHLAALERFAPAVVEAAAADVTMWILHAVGALVTIALIARGERAVMHLVRAIRRALPLPAVFEASTIHRPVATRAHLTRAPLSDQLLALSPLSRRGPPCAA